METHCIHNGNPTMKIIEIVDNFLLTYHINQQVQRPTIRRQCNTFVATCCNTHHLATVVPLLPSHKEIILNQTQFDRVWDDGVMYKLARAGIGGKLIAWFKEYLNNRTQRVVVEGEMSNTKTVTAGVPHGLILEPILFILYINDLIEEINIDIRIYADDVTMFIQ